MLQEIMQLDQYSTLYVAALSFILAALLYLSRHKIKFYWLNFKIRRHLKRMGIKQLSNIKWPDGLGHHFNIDHLIMRHNGISLLMHIRYPGKIFCGEHIDEWTQMLGQKSYSFENPFRELDAQINTLSTSIPNIPVDGFLFFDHLSEFPKGKPDRVIHYNEIPEELIRKKQNKAQENIASAWEHLLTKIIKN